MSEPHDQPATLTDDDIETRRVGILDPYAGDPTDTGDDTGDDSGDVSDTTDTGDDAGDDSGDDTGDDSALR